MRAAIESIHSVPKDWRPSTHGSRSTAGSGSRSWTPWSLILNPSAGLDHPNANRGDTVEPEAPAPPDELHSRARRSGDSSRAKVPGTFPSCDMNGNHGAGRDQDLVPDGSSGRGQSGWKSGPGHWPISCPCDGEVFGVGPSALRRIRMERSLLQESSPRREVGRTMGVGARRRWDGPDAHPSQPHEADSGGVQVRDGGNPRTGVGPD
jgi:hypothetical protein